MLAIFSICEGLLIAILGAQLVLLIFIAWQFAQFSQCLRHYIRLARRLAIAICCQARGTYGFTKSKMDCDELIDELLSAQSADDRAPLACSYASAGTAATPDVQGQEVCAQTLQNHHERLAASAGGGQAKQYFGKAFTVDQIDTLDDAEIVKLYARYKARLGAAMTKMLGSAALQLHAGGGGGGRASMFFPIENQPALVADIDADPFVGYALSELYQRYGMFLALLTVALTTMKHCQFGHQCPRTKNDDGEPTDGGRSGKCDGSSSSWPSSGDD